MASEQDVAHGLFDWINSLQLSDPVEIAEGLSDGTVIWKVLQQIDRLSFPGKLPENVETGQWVHKWTNLKHVYDALSIFLLEECGQRLPLPGGRPDLKAIAQSGSLIDTVSLLKLVVIAAINCSDRIRYLQQMQKLSESTQEVLMTTAQEAGEDESTGAEEEPETSIDALDSPRSTAPGLDNDLASEERLGKVIADNQRIAHEKRDLQNQLDDLQRRLVKLQDTHEHTVEELKDTNERLTAVLSGTSDEGVVKAPDSKQAGIIAALEARILATDHDVEDLRRTNEVLKIKSEKAQKLQDDLDEMKIDRDRLSRRANAAEKYKQKLGAIQEVEKENNSLRSKIGELQNQLKQSDSSKLSNSDLLREVDEYRRLLPSIEQERHELNEMKKRLEFDYHTLEARYHDTLDQFDRQQKSMEEMQSRLRDYEDGMAPSTPKPNGIKALDSLGDDFAANESEIAKILQDDEEDEGSTVSEEELRIIMSAMRAQAHADSTSEKGFSKQIESKLMNAIHRSYEKQMKLKDHIQKQSALIKSLQTEQPRSEPMPQTPRSPSPLVKPSPLSRSASPASDIKLQEVMALNENLHRELRLMTSAWYEQNSRFLSPGAIMFRGRPSAEPQSFLGKQRKVIEGVMLGKGGS